MDTKKRKKIMWLVIVLAVVLVAAIIATVFIVLGSRQEKIVHGSHVHTAPAPTTKGKVDAKDGYVQVAESDTYRMYYYEPRLSIRLENKKTGAVMQSTLPDEQTVEGINDAWEGYVKSGIVIAAIRGTVNTYQADLLNVENEVNTWYIDGGIYAVVNFKGVYDFTVGVEIRLEDDELVVRIPDESIKEERENTYISTISVFPMFGSTYLGEENGYMLVPDGNGALIDLSDKEGRYSTGFSGLIYGNDDGLTSSAPTSTLWERYETVTEANSVLMPVFGMAHTDDELAYLGIVEGGDERCYIEVAPNGVMIPYNRCFARFLLRDVFVQPLTKSNTGTVPAVEADRLHTDLQVRYCMLSGEDADYSGMANTYRQYLLDNNLIQRQNLSYNTRVDVLGTEREEFLMGTTSVPMTTVEQLRDIYADLRREGVANVLTVYRGWQKGGLYDLPITKYKADGKIGGTHDLTKLILDEAEQGNTIYLYNDALLVNATTNSTTYNVMKMVNKRTYEKNANGQVYKTFYYLMPDRSGENLATVAEAMEKEDLKNMAVAGVTGKLFSYSYKGNFYSRTDTMDIYTDTLAEVDSDLNMVLETPNAYLWRYADAMLDMPLGSSDYLYIDREIPFLSMVLKGIVPTYSRYVNFEANKTENFLEMVESGMYPSFYVTAEDSSKLIYTNSSNLYSLEFGSYRDTIAQYDRELRALAELVGTSCIIEHEVLPNGLVRVTYDNGIRVYVNYTGTALSADGVTVDALSYKVGE